MTNTQIYRRTFRFSIMRVLCTLLGLVLLVGLPVIVFPIAYPNENACMIGCTIAFIVGIVAYALIARYAGYLFTAGQIAMMEQGISKGELPEDAYSAGKTAVKAYFVTASVYFGLKSITDGISRDITKGLDGIGKLADGGDNGNSVVSTITGLVSVMRRYLEAGDQNPPKVDIYEKLCKLSKNFRKAFEKAEPAQAAETASV